MTTPTQKQLDYILRLHNKVTGERCSYLSQTPYGKGIGGGAASRSKEAASRIIEDLTAQLAELELEREQVAAGTVDWTAGASAVPPADQLLAMLGRKITFATNRNFTGTFAAIVPSSKDGTPALRLVDDDGAEVFTARLSKIVWFRLES
jgi:hypothetical protein